MCGIAGRWSSGRGQPAEDVAVMIATLGHRGPDSSGVWTSQQGDLAFGHARLAIVDLSQAGRQPMASHSRRLEMVFNGEVYNHQALRGALGPGLPWRGHSDTETLLECIERWGLTATLERCVGMFALAVWDHHSHTLSLARDRLGEKPLYVARGSQGLSFASEVKALKDCPGVDLARDDDALRQFVRFGFIGGQSSAYRGIRQLPPASVMVLSDPLGEPYITRYWALPAPLVGDTALGDTGDDASRLDEFDALLKASVRQQMLADVPLGAFLSGGVDSSLIVALMQSCASQPVRTFTMGFDGGTDDELLAARTTAKRLGTNHTELLVTPQDVLNTIPSVPGIYDQPFADASQIPTILLSRLTRRHVTVALSGDAGDELFGGYNRYRVASQVEAAVRRWPKAARKAVGTALLAVPASAVDAIADRARAIGLRSVPPALGEKLARLAQSIAAPSLREAYLGSLSQWSRSDASPLLEPAQDPALDDFPGVQAAQQMMCWDLQSYLTDDILVKVDRAAMAASLETRVPLLDHRIVEFAQRTPMHQKIRQGRSKWLMRELLARHLPREQFERPKQGFTVPLDQWLRGPLREWAESLLQPSSLQGSGLLNVPRVRTTWAEHLSGKRNHQRALWTVLMLQAWLDASRWGTSSPAHAA